MLKLKILNCFGLLIHVQRDLWTRDLLLVCTEHHACLCRPRPHPWGHCILHHTTQMVLINHYYWVRRGTSQSTGRPTSLDILLCQVLCHRCYRGHILCRRRCRSLDRILSLALRTKPLVKRRTMWHRQWDTRHLRDPPGTELKASFGGEPGAESGREPDAPWGRHCDVAQRPWSVALR